MVFRVGRCPVPFVEGHTLSVTSTWQLLIGGCVDKGERIECFIVVIKECLTVHDCNEILLRFKLTTVGGSWTKLRTRYSHPGLSPT